MATLLAAVLQHYFRRDDELAVVSPQNELCLRLPTTITELPPWNAAVVHRQVHQLLPALHPCWNLGAFTVCYPWNWQNGR